MRVQVGDIRLFFETYGAEWVLDGDLMRRRPVVLALHGGPGAAHTVETDNPAATFDVIRGFLASLPA